MSQISKDELQKLCLGLGVNKIKYLGNARQLLLVIGRESFDYDAYYFIDFPPQLNRISEQLVRFCLDFMAEKYGLWYFLCYLNKRIATF